MGLIAGGPNIDGLMLMATGGSAKVVEDPDETGDLPESSPKNGVPGGEEVLEIDNPIEFIDPLPNDFECSLCLQYLKQPALTSCGHHFCKQCIDRAVERSRKLKQDPACPLCKEQDFQMFIDRKTERKISSLRVYCLKKSQGCKWEGELGSLDHHMDPKEGDCVFVEVECEMGCTTRVLRKDMLKHMEENTHKHIILMSVLGSKMGGGSLESSRKLQERRAEMLQMQLCRRDEEFQQRLEGLEKKLEMKSEELADMEQQLKVKDQEQANVEERFKEKDDQLAEVKGQLQEKGKQLEEQVKDKEGRLSAVEKKLGEREKQLISVEQRTKERDKEQAEMKRCLHEKDQQIEELRNCLQRKEEQADIRRKLQEQQDGMQRQLQTSENDLKRRISELEYNLEFHCPFRFVMPNFTKLKASSTEWYGPPFYTHPGGYRLSLKVEANGHGRNRGNKLSWCLYTEPGEYDELLKWPRRRPHCYVQLLNHCTGKWEGDKRHVLFAEEYCSAGTFEKPVPARQCIDCWHNTPYSDLEYNAQKNTQYLKDDCLHFRILKIDFRD